MTKNKRSVNQWWKRKVKERNKIGSYTGKTKSSSFIYVFHVIVYLIYYVTTPVPHISGEMVNAYSEL